MKLSIEAVVRVGDGRGFIMAAGRGHRRRRIVVTAAHCLPHFPPAIGEISHTEERTYANLLAKLGEEPTIGAECTFADPIGDVAVLECPDGQVLYYDEAVAYDELTEAPTPFRMAGAPGKGEAYLLSLSNEWYGCTVSHRGGPLVIDKGTEGGMSGSPIVKETGEAIGIVCSSWLNAQLVTALPGWLLREVST